MRELDQECLDHLPAQVSPALTFSVVDAKVHDSRVECIYPAFGGYNLSEAYALVLVAGGSDIAVPGGSRS